MSFSKSFSVATSYILLSSLSPSTQAATQIASPVVASQPVVAETMPLIAPPVVTTTPIVASAVAKASVVLPDAASGVLPAPAVSSVPVAAKLPTIAPPKQIKHAKKVKQPSHRVAKHRGTRLNKPEVPVVAVLPYNQPYVELGVRYNPIQNPVNFFQRGEATWYSNSHQGQPTVNGEIYDIYGMTAAHPTLPIPSYARVTNMSNHRSVVVRINDRGPFGFHRKIIDLSYAAANKLGLVGSENRRVEILSLAQDMPTVSQPAKTAKITFKKSTKPTTTGVSSSIRSHAVARTDGRIYVQLGAFKTATAALAFKEKAQQKLTGHAYSLEIVKLGRLHRVRVGPYLQRAEAQRTLGEISLILGVQPILK